MAKINKYDAKKEWTNALSSGEMMYPAEFLIRILKGRFPKLDLDKEAFKGRKFCDVGCGDGRHLVLAKRCGFETYGVEITREIVEKVKSNLQNAAINTFDIKVGVNDDIPFADELFDYLLSWNACYYMMDEKGDFNENVKEFSRVLKKNGFLILSIPKKSCVIFNDSEDLKDGYRIIRNDPHKMRNGAIFRVFADEKEIEATFSKYFKNFVFASIYDDCFGLAYHWHIAVCQKK